MKNGRGLSCCLDGVAEAAKDRLSHSAQEPGNRPAHAATNPGAVDGEAVRRDLECAAVTAALGSANEIVA